MQIKTTLRFHLTLVIMAIFKGNNNYKWMWQNRNRYTLLVGMQISTTTMESRLEISQKTRERIAIWFLGIYPKECKSEFNRDTCTPMFIAPLFTIAKLWKQPRCPTTDEWIKKMWYIYTKWRFIQP
jgi:hypothetical protein